MTDMGDLHFFLGINVHRTASGLFLHKTQFTHDILERAGMVSCRPISTPVDTKAKLSASAGTALSDPSLYRSIVGALQYLTFTRPDITYAVQQLCLHLHAPHDAHFTAMKRVLRYLSGTATHGIYLTRSATDYLQAYSDADWAGCPDTKRSTSGYCVFLGDNLVSWSSKRQATTSRSSAEAEYRAVANAVAETSWIRNLLLELQHPLRRATLVFCDNVSAVYLSSNPVQHQRTKHVEVDIHFVRDKIRFGYHISTEITKKTMLASHLFSSSSSLGRHDLFGIEDLLLHVNPNLLHAWEALVHDGNALHQLFYGCLVNPSRTTITLLSRLPSSFAANRKQFPAFRLPVFLFRSRGSARADATAIALHTIQQPPLQSPDE
ncbi:unnamed protein product [Cuscuta campestris]|uniref:Reverse transcriptase Ty1/copia-type domain-containing protein n=1 Tax=Cuscuta campestris TaxID=132261 RepID=A0A484N407_9ASTE|nr:unnamed protein product [Cuscuta campestris]